MASAARWDVFCDVVDNFGDAGVAWRLARILASEHALDVTLWIDALAPLARIAPAIDAAMPSQRVDGVLVRAIDDARVRACDPGDVVVEAFAGGLPDRYVAAMASRTPPPRWFRLEYLALEPQLDTHHGLPSPHPSLPLARTFWFPGFSTRTGGLLRERGLFAARDAFAADAGAQRAMWTSLGVAPPVEGELRVSMFCYPHAPLEALLAAWSAAVGPISCVVADGVAAEALQRFARGVPPKPFAPPLRRGGLTLAAIPFVAQDAYDRLLWACDVNFVRGEDSFVRAQWAAKPFAWHAYPQAGSAHAAKVAAFLDRYAAPPGAPSDAVRELFAAWNAIAGAPAIADAWASYRRELAAIGEHAQRWAAALGALPELADGLVRAAENAL